MSKEERVPFPSRGESSEEDEQELQRVVRLRMSSGGELTTVPIGKSKPEGQVRASGRERKMSLKAQENRIQVDITEVNKLFQRALKEAKEAQKFVEGLDVEHLTYHNCTSVRAHASSVREFAEEWKEAVRKIRSVWGEERLESLLLLQPDQDRELRKRIESLDAWLESTKSSELNPPPPTFGATVAPSAAATTTITTTTTSAGTNESSPASGGTVIQSDLMELNRNDRISERLGDGHKTRSGSGTSGSRKSIESAKRRALERLEKKQELEEIELELQAAKLKAEEGRRAAEEERKAAEFKAEQERKV